MDKVPPTGFVSKKQVSQEGWVDEAHAGSIWQALLRADAGSLIKGGRGGVRVVPLEAGLCVVREYRRGGLMRFLGNRYFSNRPMHEFRVLCVARDLGLPVPVPLGLLWEQRGPFFRGRIATAYLEGRDLDEVLGESAQEAEMDALLASCGALFRRMHDAGLYHADLQVKNVRVTPAGLVLMDWDNARVYAELPAVQRSRNLLRFRRSLEKRGFPRHYFRSICMGYGPVHLSRWLQLLYQIKGRCSSLLAGNQTHT